LKINIILKQNKVLQWINTYPNGRLTENVFKRISANSNPNLNPNPNINPTVKCNNVFGKTK